MEGEEVRQVHWELCERIERMQRRHSEAAIMLEEGVLKYELLLPCKGVSVVMEGYYSMAEKAAHTVQLVRTNFEPQISFQSLHEHRISDAENHLDVIRTTLPTAIAFVSDLAKTLQPSRSSTLALAQERLHQQLINDYFAEACTHGFDYQLSNPEKGWLVSAILERRDQKGMTGPLVRNEVLPRFKGTAEAVDGC